MIEYPGRALILFIPSGLFHYHSSVEKCYLYRWKAYLTGTVKENREKFVRIPHKTVELLKTWKEESKATEDDDFVFYSSYTDKPLNCSTIRDIFKRGLKAAKIKNLVPY